MSTMYLKLLFSVFVFGISLKLGQTCTCFPQTYEDLYCSSSFVAKFRVTSSFELEDGVDYDNYDDIYYSNLEGFYLVRMLTSKKLPWKFEVPEKVTDVDITRLYTASNGAMCGVSLQQGTKYLISGSISYDGQLRINSCGSIVIPMPLDKNVRRQFRRIRKNAGLCKK